MSAALTVPPRLPQVCRMRATPLLPLLCTIAAVAQVPR